MTGTNLGLRRRDVLLGGAAAGALLTLGSAGASAHVAGDSAIATVVAPPRAGAKALLVDAGDGPVSVEAVDFPVDWQFAPGDRVVVDLASRRAYPFVKTSSTRDGRRVYHARNIRPEAERVIAVVES